MRHDDHEACADRAGRRSISLRLFLLEGVDELDGGEEADPPVMILDGMDAESRGDVGLAGTGTTDQDDVVRVVEELAATELAHERLIDLAAGEVEAGEVAIGREAGGLELVSGRAHLPLGSLGLQELREDRHGDLEGGRPLFGEFGDGLRHAVHLEASQHNDEGPAGRIMTHGAPPWPSAGRHSVPHWPEARWSA